mgnify:CR=1 FL=1
MPFIKMGVGFVAGFSISWRHLLRRTLRGAVFMATKKPGIKNTYTKFVMTVIIAAIKNDS